MKIFRNTVILIFILSLMSGGVFAQEIRYNLDNVIPGGKKYDEFKLGTTYGFEWKGDELAVVYYDELGKINRHKRDNIEIYFRDRDLIKLTKNKKSTVCDIKFVPIQDKYYGRIIADNEIYYVDTDKKKAFLSFKIEDDYEGLNFCTENLHYAFAKDNNLYIMDQKSEPILIAEKENTDILYGKTPYQSEFMRSGNPGTFWSPKGSYLAYYKIDQSMISNYIAHNVPETYLINKKSKLPIPGGKNEEVEIGIYNMESGKTLYLKTEESNGNYLANIFWDPSEEFIYIAEVNRKQNYMQLNKYSAETGEKVMTLFEEESNKFVEPENSLLFLETNPDQFIWKSRRNGYRHLYLYNTSGEMIKQITSGNWEVIFLYEQVFMNDQIVYILSNETSPLESHVYSVNINTGSRQRITRTGGAHGINVSKSGYLVLDDYRNKDAVYMTDIINLYSGYIKHMRKIDNPYQDYPTPGLKLGTIKAADQETDLHYRLIIPPFFEPKKKYPVIFNLIGGPGSRRVFNNWMGAAAGWELYYAQEDYIIFTLDTRGSGYDGFDLQSEVYGQLGIIETEDQIEGVKFLKSLSYVDPERIGVFGEYYGGFMVLNMMLRHPDVFKAGVSVNPISDWKYQDLTYTERYMGSPEDNPEGYIKTNMNNLAGNLQGKLLITHGDDENLIDLQNSYSFLDACKKAQTHPDHIIFPGRANQKDKLKKWEIITQYFNEHLK